MTAVLLIVGAVAAALGTRIAGVAFIAAAVVAARSTEPVAIATWTAASAAAWIFVRKAPVRSLALPAVGAAAAIAAGTATNGAVFAVLWVVATAAAVVAVGTRSSRWASALCALDVVLLVVLAVSGRTSFEVWRDALDAPLGLVLLLAGAARALLAAGPTDDDPDALAGSLIARTQALVLTFAAMGGAQGIVAEAGLVAGAIAFGTAPYFRRRAQTDVLQEWGMFTVAAAATVAYGTPDWTWGALAAGTLIYHLRLMVVRGPAGGAADLLTRSGGIALPFLPVVAVQLEGAVRARSWTAIVVALGLLAGLAGRARALPVTSRRRSRTGDVAGAWTMVGAAAVAAAWAPALLAPAAWGDRVPWPPPWAVVVLGVAGLASAVVPKVLSPTRRAPPRVQVALPDVLSPPDRFTGPRVTVIAVAVLGVGALAIWVAAATRGFL